MINSKERMKDIGSVQPFYIHVASQAPNLPRLSLDRNTKCLATSIGATPIKTRFGDSGVESWIPSSVCTREKLDLTYSGNDFGMDSTKIHFMYMSCQPQR